uniref:F-box domain-containing protein n=1 Tax=Bursaphelenchus xylophilus TaxID=6326 RepID=A0A1I7SGV7_BURXY
MNWKRKKHPRLFNIGQREFTLQYLLLCRSKYYDTVIVDLDGYSFLDRTIDFEVVNKLLSLGYVNHLRNNLRDGEYLRAMSPLSHFQDCNLLTSTSLRRQNIGQIRWMGRGFGRAAVLFYGQLSFVFYGSLSLSFALSLQVPIKKACLTDLDEQIIKHMMETEALDHIMLRCRQYRGYNELMDQKKHIAGAPKRVVILKKWCGGAFCLPLAGTLSIRHPLRRSFPIQHVDMPSIRRLTLDVVDECELFTFVPIINKDRMDLDTLEFLGITGLEVRFRSFAEQVLDVDYDYRANAETYYYLCGSIFWLQFFIETEAISLVKQFDIEIMARINVISADLHASMEKSLKEEVLVVFGEFGRKIML